ncbi:EF hand family protein [Trichomonas vaginalis G3]|uniref:EF hand family protein n=1 Tax=Trichomonas vaginalis (strain ATCC PRA-98 / G3) TaxID=412133 RepID=A2ET06_TRIV3|nr:EF-Hand calcium-binding domain-containing protein 6-related family [Trichomonas vaginalis G3]EAY04195.1 EF hand family protein [Trichomonas vaginalis G3]KAI5493069.1 EF-Hand calcium-binding domain-containing protein 6-related family [Trichomonas vaginalis G3]|eukprot:XP_001316418.1 EF hand family protein [Trichomonas vaginalis G3]
MEAVQQLIARIRQICDRNAVDIELELTNYDRKHNGIISPVSLHRWISSIGLNFTPQQVQTLADAFKKGEGVDWKSLQQSIELSKSYNNQPSSRTPNCTEELRRFGGELAVRRQTIRELLKPFDQANRGKVNPNDFYRAFGCSPLTKTLVKVYADTVTGYIDYFRLQNDVQTVSNKPVNPDAPIDELPDCFVAVWRYIKSRSVDLYGTFNRLDSSNSGKIPMDTFISAVSSTGVSLSPVDLRDIAYPFFQEDTGYCNYKQFIATIEAYKPRVADDSAEQEKVESKPRISVDKLLDDIRAIIISRRIHVSDYFDPLARHGNPDSCPIRVFGQIVASMQLSLSNDEIFAIAENYRLQNGEIDYHRFVSDIKPQQTMRSSTTIKDVIGNLKQFLETNPTTLTQSASRFDRANTGEMTVEQLQSALGMIGFEANREDLNLICQQYPGKKFATVSWRDLCKSVDPEDAELRLSARKPIEEGAVSARDPSMAAKPPKALNLLLLNIQKSANVYSLQSQFERNDKRRRGCVPNQVFLDVLLDMQLNQSEIRGLMSFFRVTGSPEVNYREFISAINHATPEEEPEPEKSYQQEKPLPDFAPIVHNFLRRFKNFSRMRRLSVTDIFEPYDPQHTGFIQVFKVAAAFNNVQFTAMRAEMEDLCSAFRDSRKKEIFNYRLFERAVEAEDIDSEAAKAGLSGEPISAEVNRDAMATCLQIRDRLACKRRRIAVAFVGIEGETIPSKEFQKRLEDVGIVLRAGQLNALFRKYRVGITDEIRWKDFCKDVENSRTIGE